MVFSQHWPVLVELLVNEKEKINRAWPAAKGDDLVGLQGEARRIQWLLDLPKRLGTDKVVHNSEADEESE
jgi:hypothetical protein